MINIFQRRGSQIFPCMMAASQASKVLVIGLMSYAWMCYAADGWYTFICYLRYYNEQAYFLGATPR